MKAILAAAVLLTSTAVHAEPYAEWDYSNTVSGQATMLVGFNEFLDPNAYLESKDVTGLYSVRLFTQGTGASMSLTGYDIGLSLSNGMTISNITSGDLLFPVYNTSTGLNTCAAHSEMTGCISLQENTQGQFTGALVNLFTSLPQADSIRIGMGLTDSISYGVPYCNAGGGDYQTYVGTYTNSGHVCDFSMSSAGSGTWTKAPTVSAPELDSSTLGGSFALVGASVLVLSGRRRNSRR